MQALDVDSHEMIPMHLWGEEFGPIGETMVPILRGLLANNAENTLTREDLQADEMEITEHNAWYVKGPDAPSAFDLTRRPAVLDVMNIERQLVFPTFALAGISMYYNKDAHLQFGYDPNEIDREDVARRAVAAHNDWAARHSQDPEGRVRPVGIIIPITVEQMIADTEDALAAGIRAIWLPAGVPPAGMSPADSRLDPFWKLVADNDLPVVNHLGTEFGLMRDHAAWAANVPVFAPSANSSLEFPLEPWRSATLHFASENYLIAMTLGGVFERHPNLRYGVIEVGAHWVPHLAQKIDLWYHQFHSRWDSMMLPSEYIARNVRVTPFYFEPVADYIDANPRLASVYCFSSDFPHREGGKACHEIFAKELERLGDDISEQFFRTNPELLLPA